MRSVNFCLFLVLGLFFPAIAAAQVASYAGTYSGTYSGGDNGTWTATISSTGSISATVVSMNADTLAASGQVASDGLMTMTSGNVSGGATFTGTINTATGTISGSWTNTYYGINGLWNGTIANAGLSITKSGSGSGTVASSPFGINCGATCSANFTGGSTVTLSATPTADSYFFGWSGACSGAGACVVKMNAAKDITAIFKPVPFVATTTSITTATSATISTNIAFSVPDVGKSGAVYATSWAPANGLAALGILSAPMSHAMSVTMNNDNPYAGGQLNTRQETLATVLATADANAFVLVQLISSGWQLVQNGQLIPYASGVLGDQLASLSILNNANPANLLGAQFCVGYGTSAAEMVAAGRMMPVAAIPGSTATTNGSCNVAANPYKGLWWNPNESGWGMSVTQHDNINFIALYTYDQSALPVWYVMSNCPFATAGSCTGDIYKVTGGTVPTATWAPSLVINTAGTGTLTFTDANHGRLDFTLNGAAGSKTIERQTFSSGTAAQAVDYTDLWWNANESGWGISLTQDVGMIFAAWYTYDAAGLPVWYVASSCPLSGSGCTGNVYKVTGGSMPTASWVPNLAVNNVGTVSFVFGDSSTGTMSYTIDGVTDSKVITRQAF